ncbi:MAG: sodium:calcium antiporter, partial [Proteobacteria bacterium]
TLASSAFALAGLALVVFGGGLLVQGATGLARSIGVSENVIGLTIVAIGTSMPELVTSVVAALRRHADVALGNVLGSNIYNVLGIGGATALIAPTAIPPEIARFDMLLMLAVAVLLLWLARTGWRIGRREGALLVASYVGYLFWIWPA